MANYIDDLETSITAMLSAYASASAVLDGPAVGQMARCVLHDLELIGRDVNGQDFAYSLRTLGMGSVSDLQSHLPAGTGDYE